MKSFWLVVLFVLVCLVSTSRAQADRVEERAPLPPKSELEVSNVAGSVEIQGWDRSEIEVVADIESSNDRLEFEVRDGRAFVGVRSDRGQDKSKYRHRGQDKEVDFVIRVPRSTRVAVNTVSADIDVRGTTGDQRLESVSGDLNTELGGREASYRTVSGDIDVAGGSKVERLKVNTVSGDADLRDVGGELRLEAVSGDLEITAGRVSRLNGNTVNGDLDFRGDLEKGGEIDFGAINGDIDIVLRSLYDTEFVLESFNGSIDSIFDYKPSRKSRYAPGRILRLIEGDGASRIRIETLNGSISIEAESEDGREPRVRHTSGRYDEVSDNDRQHRHYGDSDDDDMDERYEDEMELANEDFDKAMEELRRERDPDS